MQSKETRKKKVRKVRKVKRIKRVKQSTINRKRWIDLRKEVLEERGCKCQVCKKEGKLDLHHVISRKHSALRFDKNNLILLCPLHHKFSSIESAHNNPIWFVNWLQDNALEQLIYLKKYMKNI